MARHGGGESITRRIEQALAEAGLSVVATDDGRTIRLAGRVDTAEARQAASDVAAAVAPGRRIENDLELEPVLPESTTTFRSDEPLAGDLPHTLDEALAGGGDIEPDFTDQVLETSPTEMAGAASATDEPMPDGEAVLFPPTDPVMTTDDRGNAQPLGGFAAPSMDDLEVAPSALDDQPGDAALAAAVRRELREDALTTDLAIRVVARGGVIYLRGAVPSLDDAENAEEVAGRVPGVREVIEELETPGL